LSGFTAQHLQHGKSMVNEDLGVWYNQNPRVALKRVRSMPADGVRSGTYVYRGSGHYILNPYDAQIGLVARFLDDDGDVMECFVTSKSGAAYDAVVEYRAVPMYEPQPGDEQMAKIPRGKQAQVMALRMLFRK